jgi:hypothetical protein
MVNVTDGADVHVRLGALKLSLGHGCLPLICNLDTGWIRTS